MDAKIEELAADLLKLPSASRAYLIDVLIESLEDSAEFDDEEALSQEVARRIKEVENGDVVGIPSEQVHAEVRRQLDEARHLSSTSSARVG